MRLFCIKNLSALTLAVVSLLATSADAALIVVEGTGKVGNNVTLSVGSNDAFLGIGSLFGGTIASPSGAPDLFYRANTLEEDLDFSGSPETFVQWYSFGPFEGAVHGSDNWMKVTDSTGLVSWAQFEFDFVSGGPSLVSIPLYVTSDNYADITLAEAVAAVPEPSSLALLGLGGLLLTRRRRA